MTTDLWQSIRCEPARIQGVRIKQLSTIPFFVKHQPVMLSKRGAYASAVSGAVLPSNVLVLFDWRNIFDGLATEPKAS